MTQEVKIVYVVQERFLEKEHEDCNGEIIFISPDIDESKKQMKQNIKNKKIFYRVLIEWNMLKGTYKIIENELERGS